MDKKHRNRYSIRSQLAMMDALSPIRQILEDESVNEIMINGPNDVFVRQKGPDRRIEVELSSRAIETAITLLASFVDKEVNEKQYILSARLPGFRIECALPPVSVKGPSMTIRRHASMIMTMAQYVESGVIAQEQAELIQRLVDNRHNFLIAGGTYSGKTTLMNCVLSLIDPRHRLVVIEQISELKVAAENYVAFECDPDFGVDATVAVRLSMRYSPDRIVLGELRGGEANDWIEAANTGHPGSCATIHANSAADALTRLSTLVRRGAPGLPHEVIQDIIGTTVKSVLFIEQRYGVRKLTEICEVKGYDRASGKFCVDTLYHPRKELV